MSPADSTSLPQTLAGIAATVVVVLVAGQKILKGWKETSTESSVMSILHTELERMSTQNTKLATELSKLQLEVVNLNKELRKLTVENQQLHSEVTTLTQEVNRLQTILSFTRDKNVRASEIEL